MKYPLIFLKPGKEGPLLRKHPWVFSGAVMRTEGNPGNGDIVHVLNSSGEILATGHYQEGSIRVRILIAGETLINQAFWDNAIARCFANRSRVHLPSVETNMFRLVHGEGDQLPGLIVDVYGSTAVVQCHSAGMHKCREQIANALLGTSGGIVSQVYDKSFDTPAGIDTHLFLAGTGIEEVCRENGLLFKVDYEQGQKTGFFVDQRENRALLKQYASNRKVLNTFCYTGGFSVYALAGGAQKVVSVDSSAAALELTDANVLLNFTDSGRHSSVKADVTEWLKSIAPDFDLIILDPPAFAKHIDARHRAVQAYKRLNLTAMKKIAKGGILFTFSCSQVVDRELFRHTITSAAIESGRQIRILHQLTQGPDHPVNIFHPEGEYLKGLVLQVD